MRFVYWCCLNGTYWRSSGMLAYQTRLKRSKKDNHKVLNYPEFIVCCWPKVGNFNPARADKTWCRIRRCWRKNPVHILLDSYTRRRWETRSLLWDLNVWWLRWYHMDSLTRVSKWKKSLCIWFPKLERSASLADSSKDTQCLEWLQPPAANEVRMGTRTLNKSRCSQRTAQELRLWFTRFGKFSGRKCHLRPSICSTMPQ